MAHAHERTDRQRLDHLIDALTDDVLSLSEEEALAELLEEPIDVEAMAAACLEQVEKQVRSRYV